MDAASGLDAQTLRILVEKIVICLEERTLENVEHALAWVQETVEFESAIVCQISHQGGKLSVGDYINHSYDPEWVRTYISQDYCSIDPIIGYGVQKGGVFAWERAYSESESKVCCLNSFLEAAHDYGLRSGFAGSIPIGKSPQQNNSTLCSLANIDPSRSQIASYILRALMQVFHEVLPTNMMQPIPMMQPTPLLTPKEREVIGWAGEGKSVWETGMIIGVSESTVKFHLQNIYKKLNVTNRTHAIAKALHLRII